MITFAVFTLCMLFFLIFLDNKLLAKSRNVLEKPINNTFAMSIIL